MTLNLAEPKRELLFHPRYFIGSSRSHTPETAPATINDQWSALFQSGIVSMTSKFPLYGFEPHCDTATGSFDYFCGFETAKDTQIPASAASLVLEPGAYLAFTLVGTIADMHANWQAVYGYDLAAQGYERDVTRPEAEYYPSTFCPDGPLNGCEIWIPIKG